MVVSNETLRMAHVAAQLRPSSTTAPLTPKRLNSEMRNKLNAALPSAASGEQAGTRKTILALLSGKKLERENDGGGTLEAAGVEETAAAPTEAADLIGQLRTTDLQRFVEHLLVERIGQPLESVAVWQEIACGDANEDCVSVVKRRLDELKASKEELNEVC